MIEYVRAEPADAASPCVNICILHPVTGWCRGCGRTMDEIVRWAPSALADKRAVRAALPARMAAMAARDD